MEIEIS